MKKDFSDEIEKSQETLNNYVSGKDLRILKTDFSDKWDHLSKKLAYPYKYFSSTRDYQNPVKNLKKADFFSKLKNACASDEEIEQTKEIINFFFEKMEKVQKYT